MRRTILRTIVDYLGLLYCTYGVVVGACCGVVGLLFPPGYTLEEMLKLMLDVLETEATDGYIEVICDEKICNVVS